LLKNQATVNHNWHGLGLGVSEAKEVSIEGSSERVGFKALSQVPAELHAIIREENVEKGNGTPGTEVGVLPGRTMLNKDFTASSFAAALGRNYSLVHIASHFNFRPGDADKSFLLLGDGNSLTLEKVRTSDEFDFQGVELITLSACNTGVSMTGADGKEVEGFGAVAQERGAKAVLATLWPVADESTRELMTRFYRIYATTPNVSKAEALREAQISLLHGAETQATGSAARRSSESIDSAKSELPVYKADPHAPFSHPYYWAPFILIGNWH
jgi:CHAT domain-containing protein